MFFGFYIFCFGQSQNWKPVNQGLNNHQVGNNAQVGYRTQFKAERPLGKSWIYGTYLDEDSLRRCVSYREGGRWVHLPFSASYGSFASDIEVHHDTLWIIGDFQNVKFDGKPGNQGITTLIKYHNDSIWKAGTNFLLPIDMDIKGDSILVSGGVYHDSSFLIPVQYMSNDGGSNWSYPYSIIHPTNSFLYDSVPDFGAKAKVSILDNGDILTLNYGSPNGSPFKGIARWDGSQWHSYGNGLFGGVLYCAVEDFVFYRGELHIGGTFSQIYTWHGDTTVVEMRNPGNGIARWDGNRWQGLAGGILEGGVWDMFVYDDVLYCNTLAGDPDYHLFGDAQIPYFSGWDGVQWCGTPTDFYTAPYDIGVVNDTVFASFTQSGVVDGDSVGFMAYFDGDYLHGPNAICSTPGLGEGESELHKAEIEVFPNPANDFLNIALPQEIETASYELLSLDGKLVQSGVLVKGENTLKINYKLSGVFLLKVQTRSGVVVQKVFFEN